MGALHPGHPDPPPPLCYEVCHGATAEGRSGVSLPRSVFGGRDATVAYDDRSLDESYLGDLGNDRPL